MTFDELVLENFGVYHGRQSIDLAPPDGQKPVILFGGLNGCGKTTLLDGLHLALYGKRAKLSNRGRLPYDEYLRRSIHRGVAPSDGAGVAVQFRHRSEGREHIYRVRRSWSGTERAVHESVEVTRDGEPDDLMADAWDEYVEEFMPLGISPLFLFDGEKIEELADPHRAAEVLGSAIHGLLGLDLVDRLSTDLRVLERRKRTAAASPEERAQLELAKVALGALRDKIDGLVLDEGSLNGKVERLRTRLDELDERCRAEGGDYFEQREELETEQAEARGRLESLYEQMARIAAGAAPLLVVRELMVATAAQAEREARAETAWLLDEELEARDDGVLAFVRALSVPERVSKRLDAFLAEERAQRVSRADIERYLELTDVTRLALRGLLDHGLEGVAEETRETIDEVERAESRSLKLGRKLAAVPDRAAVIELIEARERAQVELEQLELQLAKIRDELARVRREQAQLKERQAREAKLQVERDFEREDASRIVVHAFKVRETLKQFRDAVLARHLARIEQLVLESFGALMRKESVISRLRIDPESFHLDLWGRDGRVLTPERLSAGERQLLAVSLLWGLARASERPLPAVIDTPLGRLDSSHRMHLVERYFPRASHQVLLLSTDEEIDRRYFDVLRPSIGHIYRLTYDEQLGGTSVQSGYFFEA